MSGGGSKTEDSMKDLSVGCDSETGSTCTSEQAPCCTPARPGTRSMALICASSVIGFVVPLGGALLVAQSGDSGLAPALHKVLAASSAGLAASALGFAALVAVRRLHGVRPGARAGALLAALLAGAAGCWGAGYAFEARPGPVRRGGPAGAGAGPWDVADASGDGADPVLGGGPLDPAEGQRWQVQNVSTTGGEHENKSATGGEHGAGGCLCIFDIDRTLTGKQGLISKCPNNRRFRGVRDNAYGRGDLTESDLGQHIDRTFCAGCFLGVVSHGTAGGRAMKAQLLRALASGLGHVSHRWSSPHRIASPLVLGCRNKPPCVWGVMEWYTDRGADISQDEVYFFDDRGDNVGDVAGAGFNAHQVSCASRDRHGVGLCGASTSEIQRVHGKSFC